MPFETVLIPDVLIPVFLPIVIFIMLWYYCMNQKQSHDPNMDQLNENIAKILTYIKVRETVNVFYYSPNGRKLHGSKMCKFICHIENPDYLTLTADVTCFLTGIDCMCACTH